MNVLIGIACIVGLLLWVCTQPINDVPTVGDPLFKGERSMSKRLSEHFRREEFVCRCSDCEFDTVDAELISVLEDLRTYFDRAVTINSSCRCKKHNKAIGGSKGSQQLQGKAADITMQGIDPAVVSVYLKDKYQTEYGIGTYTTFTHIDVRSEKARWRG